MKLAHFSDLHLGPPGKKKKLRRAQALIDHALDQGAEHILIGGDLADRGNLEDLNGLRKHLKVRLFLNAERLSVVPGNHDIWPFGEGTLERDAVAYCVENIKSLVVGDEVWPAQQRYEEFIELFSAAFAGTHRMNERDAFPCIKQLGPVALAMLDTTSDEGAFQSAA